MKMRVLLLVTLWCEIFLSPQLLADQFHYQNVLLGERAQGLGGAFTAVSDDASGVYYNPAGLAFALSNDISGSANAIYKRTVTYKEAVVGENFEEYSGGTFAPFFGLMQKLDKVAKGLVGGFAYYTNDTELKDQDTLIEKPESNLKRFHRTANQRANTSSLGVGAGYRVTPGFAVGVALTYINAEELAQTYQDVNSVVQVKTKTSTESADYERGQNIREKLSALGIEAALGVQAAILSSVSVGLTVKQGAYVSQSYENNMEIHEAYAPKSSNGVYTRVAPTQTTTKKEKPLGSMPLSTRFGIAWFASTRLLITADASYWGESTGGDTIADGSTQALYPRTAVLNESLGAEYYVAPSIPLRVGVFTNNDARPAISKDTTDQPDHIDYIGVSLFLGWVQPNSQIAFGGIVQQGTGEAQKVQGVTETQDVSAFAYTIGLSATHNF